MHCVDDMCTTSIVRFRFSLNDNLKNSQSLDINEKTIESESKYLSNIRSFRKTVGLKTQNKQLITETLNMNKGLSNGHQLNDSNLNNNLDINSISATTTPITPITSAPSTTPSSVSSCEPTMGLSNASTKESLTQHLLLTSLKGGKPENGQRIDLSNISWTGLKQTNCNQTNKTNTNSNTNTNDNSNDLVQSQTNDANQHHLDNSLPHSSPVNDQTVDQMIDEVLNKSDCQVSEELTQPIIDETNSCEKQQQSAPLEPSSLEQQISDKQSTAQVKSGECAEPTEERTSLPETLVDLKEQRVTLVRQTERLLRRVRRLQFTENHKHYSKQMKAFVERQQRVLNIGCQRQTEHVASVSHTQPYSNPVEDRMKLLTPEGVKGLSTSALVNLVKRLGSTASVSDTNHLHDYYPTQTSVRSHPQSSSFTSSSHSATTPPQVIPQLPSTPTNQLPNGEESSAKLGKSQVQSSQVMPQSSLAQQSRLNLEERDAILSTIDSLSSNLRHFETGFDSDATESSSGGESCDEFEEYSSESTTHYSIPIDTDGHTFPM